MDTTDRSYPLPPVELRGTRECLFIDQATGIPRDVFHFDGCFCSITQHQWENMSDLIALPVESLPTFPPCATQEDLFEAVGKPMVDSVLDGFNASILAYGQTSSGKTFTMMGTPQNEGLIPRIARSIMEEADRRTIVAGAGGGEPSPLSSGTANNDGALPNGSFTSTAPPLQRATTGLMGSSSAAAAAGTETILSRDFSMELSFFEIYNEAVLDLLQTGSTQHRRRKVRVHPAMGVYVEGLTYEKVSSWAQCLRFLTRGLQQRHTAATKMNEVSSRSHAIFQLRLVQTDMTDIGPVQHRSNAYLADLAGSERIKLSAVEGDRLKESAQINLSLTTLRRVIDALIQAGPGSGGGGNSSTASGNPTGLSSSGGGGGGSSTGKMVPYRESMLTWVLSESLGGNARACMVATLCPHPTYVEETYQTLQYAHRAKSIVNSVVKNEDQMAKMLRQLQDALAATARGGAQTAMTATASAVEGVDPSLHFELEDRVKKQDSLIRKLREEQMLMLTKYADLKDVYESLKDEHAREVDLHEVAQQQTKTLHGKYDALRQQLQALKTRNDALEATDEMRALDAQRAAMECERLEHWKTQADLAARRMEQDLAQANEERQRLRGEVDHLTTSIERTMAKHQGELHQAKLAHDRDLSAFRHLQHWYDKILHSLWEGCFSTRRVNVQLHLSSWACDWASACHVRSAALAKRVDALQAQLQDLEFVNTAQDRSLTSRLCLRRRSRILALRRKSKWRRQRGRWWAVDGQQVAKQRRSKLDRCWHSASPASLLQRCSAECCRLGACCGCGCGCFCW